ncbi:hypothetical protein FACS189442_5740 [Spirochaetia bacterium]|nr:hypothetical protein FACS189442_5740 [Spirochaetia bacterium]
MAIKTNSQYHMVLNPDLKFEPNIIDTIMAFMDADSNILNVMPKVLNQRGEIQYLAKLLPTPLDLILRRFLPSGVLGKRKSDDYILKESGYDKIINAPSLSGCFMFLRIDVFKKYNLFFDESFFMYCEDVDLCRRIHKIGKTIYFPEVIIVHEHTRLSYKSTRMLSHHIVSAVKYFNKWGWFFDNERKKVNDQTLRDIHDLASGQGAPLT